MHEVPVVDVSLDRQVRRGGRSGRQVRARQLHRGDARRGRRHAQRAGVWPTRWISSARRSAPAARATRRACGCIRRCRSSTRRCRCWRTSRCGRRFRPTELERLRKERLTTLLQTRDSAPALASSGVRAARLRPAASLRHAGDGQRGLEHRDDRVRAAGLLHGHYQPQNAYLLVVGDVTPDTVLPKLEKALRRLEELRADRQAGAAGGHAARVAADLSGRQARRGAVGHPHRLDRRRPEPRPTTTCST